MDQSNTFLKMSKDTTSDSKRKSILSRFAATKKPASRRPVVGPQAKSSPFGTISRLFPNASVLSAADSPNDSSTTRQLVDRLVSTEAVYVANLEHVVEHYIPELDGIDLPVQLSSQRKTIFGNIEQIYQFHRDQFLPQLKQWCSDENVGSLGLQLAKCFLASRRNFDLYSAYIYNKGKSDALLLTEYCFAVIFQRKQFELRDKLDLSTYLLSPCRRLAEYASILRRLMHACPKFDREQAETLEAVEEMLAFQSRRGKDLAAVDSVRCCSIDLKIQGRLLLQDDFVIFEGPNGRRSVRRVFLFEHLLLFTKSQFGGEDGDEVFIWRRAIKTSEIGLKEQVDGSDVKFELYLLRYSSDQRFIFKASTPTIRSAWVNCIRQLLLDQGALSKQKSVHSITTSAGQDLCDKTKPVEVEAAIDAHPSSSKEDAPKNISSFGNDFSGSSTRRSSDFNRKRAYWSISAENEMPNSKAESTSNSYQWLSRPAAFRRAKRMKTASGSPSQ